MTLRYSPFDLARALAREAHEDTLSATRRGTGCLSDAAMVYLTDSHPDPGAPGRREAEHQELRATLATKGIFVAGTARYPTSSTSEGTAEYTVATIFTAPDESAPDALKSEWERILGASHRPIGLVTGHRVHEEGK